MNNVVKYITILIIFSIIIILVPFLLKFYSFSFKDGTPTNWVVFVEYFGGFLNPILTIINIYIFIKLTKSVQRASENKYWVDRTQSLTFNLIDIASKEVSYFALTIKEMSKKKLDEQDQFIQEKKVIENINIFNNQVTENEFKLRLYVESDIFINCTTRLDFLTSINDLVPKMNDFLKVFEIPEPDKRKELAQKFSEIEKCTKKIIENGKKFCDEIYNSL